MVRGFGGIELVVVLVIVLLVFGVGRITKIAGELGGGIRAFRKGLRGDEEEEAENEAEADESTEIK